MRHALDSHRRHRSCPLALTPAVAQADEVDISVLSSRADQVSGGDALVRVDAPADLRDKLQVLRNGTDVTDAFQLRDGGLVGLVDGLALGENELTVRHNRRSNAPFKARLGLYGDWEPTAAQVARLEAIFPTGVCDYSMPDVGRPLGL